MDYKKKYQKYKNKYLNLKTVMYGGEFDCEDPQEDKWSNTYKCPTVGDDGIFEGTFEDLVRHWNCKRSCDLLGDSKFIKCLFETIETEHPNLMYLLTVEYYKRFDKKDGEKDADNGAANEDGCPDRLQKRINNYKINLNLQMATNENNKRLIATINGYTDEIKDSIKTKILANIMVKNSTYPFGYAFSSPEAQEPKLEFYVYNNFKTVIGINLDAILEHNNKELKIDERAELQDLLNKIIGYSKN